MIKLEQVSTMRLIKYLSYTYFGHRKPQTDKELERNRSYELLVKYNITNYGQLKEYIESGAMEFQINYLKNALFEAEVALYEARRNNREPVLYSCEDYKGLGIDRKTLDITDRETNGGVLLYGNILSKGTAQRNVLKCYSIYNLKQMLNNVVVTRCNTRGENALVNNLREFGNDSAMKLRDTINFYERQVARQANEYMWCRDVDLFSIDDDLKTEAAEEQIDEVMMYLLDNASECVWGPFTDKQKRLLDKAVGGSRHYEVEVARDNMIDAISNYTTLGELEEGLVRTRVINRFIRK